MYVYIGVSSVSENFHILYMCLVCTNEIYIYPDFGQMLLGFMHNCANATAELTAQHTTLWPVSFIFLLSLSFFLSLSLLLSLARIQFACDWEKASTNVTYLWTIHWVEKECFFLRRIFTFWSIQCFSIFIHKPTTMLWAILLQYFSIFICEICFFI